MIRYTIHHRSPHKMGKRQSKLHKMFDKVRVASRGLEDDKKWWQKKKELLKSIETIAFSTEWLKSDPHVIAKIMSLPEFDREKQIIKVHHFAIQQIRIPLTELPTIRWIIQIAFNIGQLEGTATPEFLKYIGYEESGLKKLETYISSENIEFISRQLNPTFLNSFYKLL